MIAHVPSVDPSSTATTSPTSGRSRTWLSMTSRVRSSLKAGIMTESTWFRFNGATLNPNAPVGAPVCPKVEFATSAQPNPEEQGMSSLAFDPEETTHWEQVSPRHIAPEQWTKFEGYAAEIFE